MSLLFQLIHKLVTLHWTFNGILVGQKIIREERWYTIPPPFRKRGLITINVASVGHAASWKQFAIYSVCRVYSFFFFFLNIRLTKPNPSLCLNTTRYWWNRKEVELLCLQIVNNLPLHVAVCTKFLMFEIALKLSASNTNMLFGSLPISFSSLMSKPPTPIANIVIPAALAESDGPWTSSPDRPSVMTTPTRGMLSDVGLAPPLALNKSFLIRSIAWPVFVPPLR